MTSLVVAVNLSVRQFKDPNILTVVSNSLIESKLDAKNLEIEITESVLMQNTHHDFLILETLKKMGICISIDDFGTGFSSFSYLKKFIADYIKIDKSFIDDIDKEESEAIVSAIISMTKILGLRVIAEGVETEQQLAILKKLGCDEIQGYLFSRPQDVATITTLLQDNLLR